MRGELKKATDWIDPTCGVYILFVFDVLVWLGGGSKEVQIGQWDEMSRQEKYLLGSYWDGVVGDGWEGRLRKSSCYR